ncbi:MAG: spore maturation protein [Rhodospirillaceae bacterium]|nr:spore maturation protein [Rhodospirillaceae bacterium]MBT3928561.1 spore maturation protein [Rhodospirillaceae bacterium]MBT4428737.1 spore maturation protein [Rhodospirillaceae bacterium]MBT7291343.1 spore maturation protein [Rhodospirillaceae bacterium]
MNGIFFAIVLISFAVAAVRHLPWLAGAESDVVPMDVLGQAMISSATDAVTLAIGLVGVMALFLGLMKVAERGGLLVIIARLVRPMMVRLFPEIPPEHPAMGAMILNMSANALGLGNAATPFGIRAMQQLDKLNPIKGTASNAMILFLAINTSSVTLLATGVIALRAASGSENPAGIVPTTLVATICSTATAIVVAKLCMRWFPPATALPPQTIEAGDEDNEVDDGIPSDDGEEKSPDGQLEQQTARPYPAYVSFLVLGGIAGFIPLTVFYGREIAPWIIPGLMLLLLGFGVARRVRIYEVFVEGARDGFQVALRIIPYLVAILVAVGMFRASGALEMIIAPIGSVTAHFGMPAEALPMALLRPLSGSGAYGILASIINDPAIGPDSYTGYLVSTLQGSTETTFYVLAVYFGAVQIRRIRYALIPALSADLAGIIAAVAIVWLMYG